MPRVRFDGRELDGNFKIQDGVIRTLKTASIARVDVLGIEKVYDLPDANQADGQASLEEKCRAIAMDADADFEVRGKEVWFSRNDRS